MEEKTTAVAEEAKPEAPARDLIRIIMPSEGDMELVDQKGGVLTLKPVYFGGECAGPIIQFLSGTGVKAAYRVKIRNGELKLAKAELN